MVKQCNKLTSIFLNWYAKKNNNEYIKKRNKYLYKSGANLVRENYLKDLIKYDLSDYINIVVRKNKDGTYRLEFFRLSIIDMNTLQGLLRLHNII